MAEYLLGLHRRIQELDAEIAELFGQHPQAKIILSMPGMEPVLGAEVLAAIGVSPGGDHDRRVDATRLLVRMHEATALWSVGQVTAAELVDVTRELLVVGFDGLNLAMLGGVHVRHADEEVSELLDAALTDVGLSYYREAATPGRKPRSG